MPVGGFIEVAKRVAKRWQALVVAGLFGVLGAVQFVRESGEWVLWVMIALLAVAGAAVLVAREALTAGGTHSATEVHHHHYAPGSTIHFGATTPRNKAPTTPRIGPSDLPSGEREAVRLADYIEYDGGSPMIRERWFQNVTLLGPLVVFPIKNVSFSRVSWGVANNDINTAFFVTDVGDSVKLGIVGLRDCVFENCVMEHVALVGSREGRERFRSALAGESGEL